MTREIKFRAWGKYNKKMYEVLGYEGRLVKLRIPDEEFTETSPWTRLNIFSHDCELMQYTGLKDKNGKEIYEGDILKCPEITKESGWKQFSREVLVEWDNSIAGFALSDEEISDYGFEVVGNIYENPELLKDRND